MREEGLDVFDHLSPVGLEGIRRVVVAVAEEDANAEVDDPVHDQLRARVVENGCTVDEARAEGTLVAFFEQPLVGDDVVGAVRAVGHDDRDGIALEGLQAGAHGEAEAVAITAMQGSAPAPIRAWSLSFQRSSRPAIRSQSSIASSVEQAFPRPPPML
jgi:hypothetical protein